MIQATATPIPTGGAIMLDFQTAPAVSSLTGNATITRNIVGGASVQVWTGDGSTEYLFLDANDGQPGPLPSGQQYTYTITDQTGSFTTAAVSPISQLLIIQQNETALLARLIEAAVANVVIPPIITDRPAVSTAMPIVGLPPLPLIVVNLDLLQQEDIPIGQDVEKTNPDGITATIGGHAKFMWRVSVLCRNAASRDFWRDALIAIFHSLCGSVFAPIGKNMSHRYQAASFQAVKNSDTGEPGFYGADIMLELTGVMNMTYSVSYGLIEHIDFTAVFPDGVTQVADVPLAH